MSVSPVSPVSPSIETTHPPSPGGMVLYATREPWCRVIVRCPTSWRGCARIRPRAERDQDGVDITDIVGSHKFSWAIDATIQQNPMEWTDITLDGLRDSSFVVSACIRRSSKKTMFRVAVHVEGPDGETWVERTHPFFNRANVAEGGQGAPTPVCSNLPRQNRTCALLGETEPVRTSVIISTDTKNSTSTNTTTYSRVAALERRMSLLEQVCLDALGHRTLCVRNRKRKYVGGAWNGSETAATRAAECASEWCV